METVMVRLPSMTRASVTDWKKPELTLPNDVSTAMVTGTVTEVSLIPMRRNGASPGDNAGKTISTEGPWITEVIRERLSMPGSGLRRGKTVCRPVVSGEQRH